MSSELDPELVKEKLEICQSILQYRFQDLELLERCLTHSSIAQTRLASNERLEFLGDAVLGMMVCELLFQRFPEATEGELTRLKSALVSRKSCARVTRQLGLQDVLLLGKGLTTGSKLPLSIEAAVLESVIAGVYLDGGFDAVQTFIYRALSTEIERVIASTYAGNYKSQLQQVAQKEFTETPGYRLLDEKGPDHSKCFKVAAIIGSEKYPAAWGNSKKEAEQRAALNALHAIQGKEIPWLAD